MRTAGRIDDNQPQIVEALRRAGAMVEILSGVGGGVPDLLVAWRGVYYAIEIKDGAKPPSARKLTPDQDVWHSRWAKVAPVHIAECEEDAFWIIGMLQEEGDENG